MAIVERDFGRVGRDRDCASAFITLVFLLFFLKRKW